VSAAAPFTAKQCPECKVWIHHDPTSAITTDYIHWKIEHEATEPEDCIGFPYFFWNEETVDAIQVSS
jgi:hypothetical protein